MILIDAIDFVVALLLGMFLAGLFFVGLFWTVQQLHSCKNCVLLFLGSLLLRVNIVGIGFYFLLNDSLQKLLVGLIGFSLMRLLTIRFMGMKKKADYAT